GLVVDSGPDGLPSVAVAIEIAVLQLYPRALRRLDEEPHFDLASEIGVGLDLPPRADVPTEDDAVRRLERKDARPSTLAPVDRTIVDVAPDSRLEHGLGNCSLEQVVLAWLEIAEAFGEYLERFADRRVHQDLTTNGRRRYRVRHFFLLLDRSTTFRKPPKARTQKSSSCSRSAATPAASSR